MAEITTDFFLRHMERWLEDEKKKDEQFARQVENSGKTVQGCCNYILSQVRASGRQGFCDDEVYGMARHFFDETDVKDPGKQGGCQVVVPEHIELSESEKAEAMKKAEQMYLQELRKEAIAKEKAEAEKERKRKAELLERRKAEKDMQQDLFGF